MSAVEHNPQASAAPGPAARFYAVTGAQGVAGVRPRPIVVRPSTFVGVLEAVLAVSGMGLALFMVMHLGLLFSVLLGSRSMDALAQFLERYYLLQAVAPLIILVAIVHIFVAARKAPTSFRQQQALFRQLGQLRHLDTWFWAVQVFTAGALIVIGATHLWVVLNDLPIAAAKSGARVYGIYLWFYIPFILLVETHTSMGLYRVAVKWGLLARRRAHIALAVWTAAFWGLGFAILATLFWIGAGR